MPEACFAIGELIDIMPYNMIEKHLTNNTVTVNIKAIFKCIDRDKAYRLHSESRCLVRNGMY